MITRLNFRTEFPSDLGRNLLALSSHCTRIVSNQFFSHTHFHNQISEAPALLESLVHHTCKSSAPYETGIRKDLAEWPNPHRGPFAVILNPQACIRPMISELIDCFSSITGFHQPESPYHSFTSTAAIPSRNIGWSSTVRILMGEFVLNY